MKKKYDFGGWATKYNVTCSDGRTISHNAFSHCDDKQVCDSRRQVSIAVD